MDLVEVNEAFPPQYLAVEKETRLPRVCTNVDGRAIALGRRRARHGLGAACVGGGQGIAVVVESLL